VSALSQSTSNQSAYGDSRPSRSSDHHWAFCDSGSLTAMWFGTTSSRIPRPGLATGGDHPRERLSPPSSRFSVLWSTTS
jgi:hypothetical protein